MSGTALFGALAGPPGPNGSPSYGLEFNLISDFSGVQPPASLTGAQLLSGFGFFDYSLPAASAAECLIASTFTGGRCVERSGEIGTVVGSSEAGAGQVVTVRATVLRRPGRTRARRGGGAAPARLTYPAPRPGRSPTAMASRSRSAPGRPS